MIIEVNGQQVEVDDSFDSLPPEQKQAALAHITQAMQPPEASVEVRGASPEDLVNPLIGTGVGAVAGEVFGPIINKGMEAARKGAPVAGAAGAPGSANGAAPGQKYAAKTGYGSGPGYTTEEVIEHKKAQERPIGKGKISGKIAGNSPMNLDQMMALDVEKKAEAARRAATLNQGMSLGDKIMSKMPGPVQSVGRFLGGATQSGVAPWLGRAVAGGGVGFQGADAYNRYQQGDYPGAAISTIGAMGAGSSFFPTPVTRLGGPAISVGAEVLNAYLDKLKQKAEQPPAPPPAPAQAPLSPQGAAPAQPAPQAMAKGGLATLAGGGKAEAAKKLLAPVATKILKASEALGPHEGKWLNVTQSDRMRSTMGDLGGPGFSKFQLEKPEYAAARAAWGVGKKPTASGIVNVNKRFPEGQAIWTPMIGGETQHHSNQHVYDALSDEFKRQSGMGKLPKELQERMNTRLAKAPATKGMFPAEFDIGNPEHLAKYGDTFNRRGALSTLMSGEGVGGAKGRIIDYPGIMQEMTDPMTVGAPTHSLGTRLFTLNNEVEHRPDLHSAFPYILKGQDQGVAFAPVPKELGIQDFISQFKDFKGREPGYYDLVRTTPSQQVTEKYLRSLEEAGHKKGGKVKKK